MGRKYCSDCFGDEKDDYVKFDSSCKCPGCELYLCCVCESTMFELGVDEDGDKYEESMCSNCRAEHCVNCDEY